MRRFLTPIPLVKQYTRLAAQTRPTTPPKIPEFNPQNQNHLAKAIAQASMHQTKRVKSIFGKEDFLKQFPKATAILNICKSYELDEVSIMGAIERNLDVLDFDYSNISSIIHQFQVLGFNKDAITTIISQYPHVLQYRPDDLANTMDAYRKKHFGERFIIKLLISYPLLLSLSDAEIENRLSRINYLMQNRINRTTNLLLRNPSLMCCDWADVEKKFDYLYKTMRVTEKDISRSQALTLPLSHIILRHTFLDRAGVYKRPSMKDEDNVGLDGPKNPSLSDIVDTNDEEFARRVAKVSPAEFEVFKALMNYEDELEKEDDVDNESELNLSSEFDVNSR